VGLRLLKIYQLTINNLCLEKLSPHRCRAFRQRYSFHQGIVPTKPA
jgi:hypothetical protein